MNLKEIIIHHLENNYRDFEWSGKICRAIHDITGTKEEVISRRLRELVRAGLVESSYERIENKGAKCVKYRVSKLLVEAPVDNPMDMVQESLLPL